MKAKPTYPVRKFKHKKVYTLIENKCSKCQSNPAKPNQRYCKECHAEYMREWRLKEKGRLKHSDSFGIGFIKNIVITDDNTIYPIIQEVI